MSTIIYNANDVIIKHIIDKNIIEKTTTYKVATAEYNALKNINSVYIRKALGELKSTVWDGYYKIELEYIDGYTLNEIQFKNISFPKDKLLNQLLLGYNDIYQAKYIHRDIKPENIMWIPTEEKIKYIDFGYAKKISHFTITTKKKGTPLFIHPELLSDKQFLMSNDLYYYDRYSLACVIKYLFTGKTFYEMDNIENASLPKYKEYIKNNPPNYNTHDCLVNRIIIDLIKSKDDFDINTFSYILDN